MNFRPEAFLENFHYLVSGMVGIFVVIGILIIISVVLNKIKGKKQ